MQVQEEEEAIGYYNFQLYRFTLVQQSNNVKNELNGLTLQEKDLICAYIVEETIRIWVRGKWQKLRLMKKVCELIAHWKCNLMWAQHQSLYIPSACFQCLILVPIYSTLVAPSYLGTTLKRTSAGHRAPQTCCILKLFSSVKVPAILKRNFSHTDFIN